MSLGNRIKEERERLRYSQTDFAAIGGASKGSQIAWEKGGVFPNAFVLGAWAAIGADVLYIVTGRREPKIDEKEGPVNPIEMACIALELAKAFEDVGLTGEKFKLENDYPYSAAARWAARIGKLCGEIHNSLLSQPPESRNRDAICNMARGVALAERNLRLEGEGRF